MARASGKMGLRLIRDTFSRFASIMAITALGVAVFSGLKSTAPDMRRTAQQYLDESRFMDVRIVGTAGLTEADLDAVKRVAGVAAAQPGYSADASVALKETSLTVRLLSMPEKEQGINRPQIVEGRMPANDGECLADPRFLAQSGLKVGDRVTLASGTGESMDGTLKQDTFTICGVANSPLYISYERGSSSIGAGVVNAYLLLPATSFTMECNTEICLTVENPQRLSRFDDGHDETVQPVLDKLEALGDIRSAIRYRQLRDEGAQKLTDARKKVEDGEKELADAAQKLADARREIADGEKELADAEADFNKQIADGRKKLKDAYRTYSEGAGKWQSSRKLLASARARYRKGSIELEAAKAAAGLTGKSAGDIEAVIQLLQAQLALLPPGSPPYLQLAAQIEGLGQLTAGQRVLDKTLTQIKAGERKLYNGKIALDSAKAEIDRGRLDLKKAEADGRKEISKQKQKLEDARQELADGEKEYREQDAEAQPKLRDARQEIADGQKQLDDLKEPRWIVLGIDKNAGFEGYRQDTERIGAVAVVFPMIFFLVAALVSLTTMTRLVEDERTLAGTLKALGYGKGTVTLRYLIYASAASLSGSAIGLAIGYNLFPRVIFNAYRILYTLPDLHPTLDLASAIMATAAAVVSVAAPALLVCGQTLRASPAELMLPKAPPPGRRILLERVGLLWKRMRFTQKVTARNLFRYKKRLIMTVVGIAGCTALTLTGFGLMDSITSIVDRQYGAIRTYDMELNLKDGAEASELAKIDHIAQSPPVSDALYLRQQPVDAVAGGVEKSAYLMVPKQPELLPSFIRLQRRSDGQAIALPAESVVITEKLALLCKLKPGDSMILRDKDGAALPVTIGGIAENYVYHYVYMAPLLYEKLNGKAPEYNQLLCHVVPEQMELVAERLLQQDAVLSLTRVAKLRDNFGKMVGSLKVVVAVLILSAATLAFVVLFSLTSINIDERTRELATIKVLGFYNREMAGYILRENTWLTMIGTAVGLALGVALERFVIITAEVDLVMFGRAISLQSFVLSALLTFLFAALVNAVMMPRFRRIDMAATMKSGE